MKKIIFALFFTFLGTLYAQDVSSGVVEYETTVQFKLNIQTDDGPPPPVMDQMPIQRSFKHLLYFTPKQSYYLNGEDDGQPTEISSNQGGAVFNLKMPIPEVKIYRNLETGEATESRDFLGKYFLIKGTPKGQNWKMTKDIKTINNYVCQKAVYVQDSLNTIEAWFSPQIPVSVGPETYAGLPGLILEMNFNDGRRIIKASKITLKPLANGDIIIPQKGKEVTYEEFEKIKEEKMKEMGARKGPGGEMRVIIRTEN